MIEKIIGKELIQLKVQAVDWKDAIHKSGKPLVDSRNVTQKYVEEIIHSVEEYGPYFVIAPHVALAHAPSEFGANRLAMGITTLTPGIKFNNADNDPVRYVFTLSSPDSESHLKAMQELVELLSEKEFYKILDDAEQPEDVLEYVNKIIVTNEKE